MKIRTKLLVSFVLVAIIAGILGLYAIRNMKRMEESDNRLYEQVAVPFEILNKLTDYSQEIRVNYALAMSADTITDAMVYINKIRDIKPDFEDQISKYEALLLDQSDKKVTQEFQKAFNDYVSQLSGLEEMIRNHDNAGKVDHMNKVMVPLRNRMVEARDDMITSKLDKGKTLSDGNTEMANSSMTLMTVLIIIAVLLSIIFGVIIAGNIQKIIKSVVEQTNKLVSAAVNGNLDARADILETNEEFRDITKGINNTLDAVIGPLNMAAEYIDRIGNGDIPEKITDNYNGDFNEIKNSINRCIDALDNLSDDITKMIHGQKSGDIEVRCEANKLEGGYLKLAEGINDALDIVISPVLESIEVMNNYANGDLTQKMRDLPGKQIVLTQSLNLIRTNVRALISDSNLLADAALEGNLSARADATKHQGDYRAIIEGINNTLDALINPLNMAANHVARIAIGDMPEVIVENYKGEFNSIKNNLNLLINSINEIINKAKMVADGDLTVDLKKRSDNDELMESLNEMVKSTAEIITEFQNASDNISASSQQMSSTSQQISQGATEQASSAEEVSSSMEEMLANIQQNTDNAQQTEKIALNASEGIDKVNKASSETLKFMEEIADKVSIIGEIARQTNILALNAAVEAARAGEHGKGFAVVAAEVRKLAERSQISAVEIDELTKNSVKATDESSKLLAAIAPEIGKTAKLVQEIAAASIEQNSGADQVNNAIQQLNQVTQQNAASSEEMATSSEELAGQAEQLLEMISFFKLINESQKKKKKVYGQKADKALASAVKINPGSNGHKRNGLQDALLNEKSNTKGVNLDMGKDHLDNNYEKF
ncbi:MAG TPA: methyl-accepting chemotaxis protein [Bacteroidales bacterium]|nr:methyl-accepting chemotaxis protein [Bacteroidales bacterium]